MNPEKHKKEWNAIRLIMTVSEINYLVFLSDTSRLEMYPVTQNEFRDYYYNPN